jgi:HrpA-like RNA helicase
MQVDLQGAILPGGQSAGVFALLEYPLARVQGSHVMTGAILVFLPGWEDIATLKANLTAPGSPLATSSYSVLPLHSQVAPSEQRCVFQKLPGDVRKIVLATNIAETAVTIEDVVFVINSGRMKEKSYDPFTGVSTLQSTFTSKASERQRRGRAGRCQPGLCFHMYSKHRSSELVVHSHIPSPSLNGLFFPLYMCMQHTCSYSKERDLKA